MRHSHSLVSPPRLSVEAGCAGHLGDLLPWMVPHGRGFDTSLSYLSAEEDHYFHTVHKAQFGCPGIDLWRTSAPAYGEYNGTYSAFMFNHEIRAVLQQHNASVP